MTDNISYRQNGVQVSIPSISYGVTHVPVHLYKYPDPVLTQNPKKAGRSGRKQWKIRRTNGGKKHKSEPKRLRFALETTYGPEGRGFESLTAYQKSSKSSDFEDFCFS